MRVLEWQGKLTPADDSTHILLPFTVPPGMQRMQLDYAYFPKQYQGGDGVLRVLDCYRSYGMEVDEAYAATRLPLNNHVTLSLDAPGGRYVGAAHRHANQQRIVLSATMADAGFTPTPILPGAWRVVLSAHALLSDAVDVTLEVQVW